MKEMLEKYGITEEHWFKRKNLFHWRNITIYETEVRDLDSNNKKKLYEFLFENSYSAEIFLSWANHYGLHAFRDTVGYQNIVNNYYVPPNRERTIFIDTPEDYIEGYKISLSNLPEEKLDLLKRSYEYYFFEKNILPILRLQFEEAKKIDMYYPHLKECQNDSIS